MTRLTPALACLCTLLFAVLAPAMLAADDQTKDQLKERFQQRDADLRNLKDQAKAGETFEGWVEATSDARLSASERRIIEDENADRRALYRIIAREQGVSESNVAAHAARGNFRYAQTGDWLKYPDGWKQKE